MRCRRCPYATSAPASNCAIISGKKFRRILQIGIYDHDAIAAGDEEACGHRQLVSVVMREVYSDHLRLGRRQPQNFWPRLIGRTIVDKDQFVVVADATFAGLGQPADEFLDVSRLIVTRYHRRQLLRSLSKLKDAGSPAPKKGERRSAK